MMSTSCQQPRNDVIEVAREARGPRDPVNFTVDYGKSESKRSSPVKFFSQIFLMFLKLKMLSVSDSNNVIGLNYCLKLLSFHFYGRHF